MYRIVLLVGCLLAATTACRAQQPSSASMNAKPLSYPDSAEGLRQFFGDAIEAAKSGDEGRLLQFVQEMEIPDYDNWFGKTFSSADAARLAVAYRGQQDAGQKDLLNDLKSLAKRKGELVVERFEETPKPYEERVAKAVRQSLKQPAVFYSLAWKSSPSSPYSGDSLGHFMFVDGAFRRLTYALLHQLSALSNAPPRIRQGGTVQANRLLNKVAPKYPSEAWAQGVQGLVRLSVIVATDGTISELRVVSGDPLLVDVAVQAVRQWRYKPTLLNGQPVEVETTIDIAFSLSR